MRFGLTLDIYKRLTNTLLHHITSVSFRRFILSLRGYIYLYTRNLAKVTYRPLRQQSKWTGSKQTRYQDFSLCCTAHLNAGFRSTENKTDLKRSNIWDLAVSDMNSSDGPLCVCVCVRETWLSQTDMNSPVRRSVCVCVNTCVRMCV